jgi:hypothetical protein
MLKVASIVSTPHLRETSNNDYFMALAHLVPGDEEYAAFFRDMSDAGKFVLMDNGVVETGTAMPIDRVLEIGAEIKAKEIILPDQLGNMAKTIDLGMEALHFIQDEGLKTPRLLAVPQGETLSEWLFCLKEMSHWPIHTIGISRFGPAPRAELIYEGWKLGLFSRFLDIHLLGCKADPIEVARIVAGFPSLNIRGVDSAFPFYYALKGIRLPDESPVPREELDFHGSRADSALLAANIAWWEYRCRGIL